MRALVLAGTCSVAMRDVATPRPGPGDALVEVRLCGICGSDVHGFLGQSARRRPGLVMGHEATGVVREGPTELVGRRVAINPLISCGHCEACRGGRQNCCPTWRLLGLDETAGGFAPWVVVPARNIHAIPDTLSDEASILVEPVANAVHLMAHLPAEVGPFPTALIIGGGPLGAAVLRVAQARGVRIVAVSERNPRRREVALRLGAPKIIPPSDDVAQQVRELTGGRGADIVFDAVGTDQARQTAVASVARGGTVMLLGTDDGPTTFDFLDVVRREIRLQGSYAYDDNDFAQALELVARGIVDFADYTDVVPLEEGQAAFERLATSPGDRLKVALRP